MATTIPATLMLAGARMCLWQGLAAAGISEAVHPQETIRVGVVVQVTLVGLLTGSQSPGLTEQICTMVPTTSAPALGGRLAALMMSTTWSL